MRREGYDYEDHNLLGSNSVTHIYGLQNHQLSGKHFFGDNGDYIGEVLIAKLPVMSRTVGR